MNYTFSLAFCPSIPLWNSVPKSFLKVCSNCRRKLKSPTYRCSIHSLSAVKRVLVCLLAQLAESRLRSLISLLIT